MQDVPYLLRDVRLQDVTSSILRSSSKYLNNGRLREWVAMICLRRNGSDFPVQAELVECFAILNELRDLHQIEELFTKERKANPALNAWFSEGFISERSHIDDYARYEPGTLGGILHAELAGNFEIEIDSWKAPETQYDFYWLRHLQTHDFHHVLTGGGFDAIGELIPSWFGMTNLSRHIDNRQLLSELETVHVLAGLRIMVRTMLHYPEVWDDVADAIKRGMTAGEQSDALFMKRIEPALALPLAEARELLGVRGVVDRDTSGASAFWNEKVDVVPPRGIPWQKRNTNAAAAHELVS